MKNLLFIIAVTTFVACNQECGTENTEVVDSIVSLKVDSAIIITDSVKKDSLK